MDVTKREILSDCPRVFSLIVSLVKWCRRGASWSFVRCVHTRAEQVVARFCHYSGLIGDNDE